jgi:hypothetical protein
MGGRDVAKLRARWRTMNSIVPGWLVRKLRLVTLRIVTDF